MTRSEAAASKAFATFRVAGDRLVPDEITRILKTHPTVAYAKGQAYTGPNSSKRYIGKTGVWFLSTDTVVESDWWRDHLNFLVFWLFSDRRFRVPQSASRDHRADGSADRLRAVMRERGLKATVTLFWHGAPGERQPAIPRAIRTLMSQIPAALECDFESDRGSEEVA